MSLATAATSASCHAGIERHGLESASSRWYLANARRVFEPNEDEEEGFSSVAFFSSGAPPHLGSMTMRSARATGAAKRRPCWVDGRSGWIALSELMPTSAPRTTASDPLTPPVRTRSLSRSAASRDMPGGGASSSSAAASSSSPGSRGNRSSSSGGRRAARGGGDEPRRGRRRSRGRRRAKDGAIARAGAAPPRRAGETARSARERARRSRIADAAEDAGEARTSRGAIVGGDGGGATLRPEN